MLTANHRTTVGTPLPQRGELAELMAARDWAETPLGPPDLWPQSLRTLVRTMLASRYPMWMAWGAQLTFFYNDAYRPTLGTKHPRALGRSAADVWSEIWPDIGPLVESVLRTGEATWNEALQLFLERHGFPEETYHTFSYSPVPDDAGGVGGMLCVVTEETERVVGARRLVLLKELAAGLAKSKSTADVYAAVDRCIRADLPDLPFALIYAFEPDGSGLRLQVNTALPPGHAGAPLFIDPGSADGPWDIQALLGQEEPALVQRLDPAWQWPQGEWPWQPLEAKLLTIAQQGNEPPAGVFIAGLNPHRRLDQPYRDFLRLLTGQISAGLANANAYEAERRRAELLHELDRAKTAFFSNVSHEFRTPLTLILGPLADLLQGLHGPLGPEQGEQVEVIQRNALRLLKLVNTLLDFSRLEAGRAQARFQATNLAGLTADLSSAFRSAVERAGIALVVDCTPLEEPVYVDRSMWEKVVLNLLSNAFKFTFDGRISVGLAARGGHAVLTVTDTGTGIPHDELPRLFERFHRIEGARSRTHEGSGIGLALVHEIVKLHGGAIRAASELGRGSCFTVELPLGAAHLNPDQVGAPSPDDARPASTEAWVQEVSRWLPEGVPADAPPRRAAAAGDVPRGRIVLADDNADMRDYVTRLISARYDVDAHPNGARALEAIRARRPDLVLTDVMMPELDGRGLLQALRADPSLRSLPVVMLSARSGQESAIEGLEAGADDYIVKPFTARELLARVGTHVEMARVRAEVIRRERELVEQARNSKEQVERILSSVNDAFITLDHDLRFTYVNERAAAIGGTPAADLIGLSVKDWPPALSVPREVELLRLALREGTVQVFEAHFAPSNRWLEVRAYPYADGLSVFATDITERKEAEAALRGALLSEQRAVKYRDEFLGVASHELRTPLSSVKMQLQMTQLAARRQGGLERVPLARFEKLLQVLDRQVSNLDRLVCDLLDASRVANGQLSVEPENVDLVALVQTVTIQFSEDLAAAGCALQLDTPAALEGRWDSRRLEQVFVNLLTNAIKYAPGQPLEIRVVDEGPRVLVTVRDHGPGIAPEHHGRIFGRFERATARAGIPGLGIGLYVSNEIVQAHGGSLRVQSEPGEGATFIVELPRSTSVSA